MPEIIELKSIQKITKTMMNSQHFERYEKLMAELKELQSKTKLVRKDIERVLDDLKNAV